MKTIAAAVAAALLSLQPSMTVAGNVAMPDDLQQFLAKRAQTAFALTGPIAICVAHHDTSNPAFHGCIDWHSSVHGTWALTAYTWMTGDHRYKALIDSILQPAALANEQEHLARDPTFEMPYGRAWFLRLALDYHRAFGSTLLDSFGDFVAESLVTHYMAVRPDPASIAYRSSTWALINLYDYAASRHDAAKVEFVKEQVRQYYMADDPCPIERLEVETREFMAVCTNWAWLVQRVLPPAEFKPWLAHFLPPSVPLDPIASPDSVHQSGLNFSRTWGLWNLYYGTGDPRFLNAYLANFTTTFDRPQIWNGDYGTLAHWIAQFGMLGLMVTFYDIPNHGKS